MTLKQVNRLWWSQSWRWVVGLMAVIFVIGMGTAVKITQGQYQSTHPTVKLKTWQTADYRKHPDNYKVNGRRVSLEKYNVDQNQFFSQDEYKIHHYEIQKGAELRGYDVWYYFTMLTAGLILAFWGRRTHYFEFLLSLGATRQQLFFTQLGQALALALSVAVAQLVHWGWIIAMIPAKYQVHRNLAGLFGSNVPVVAISLGLLVLGWFVGLLNNRFWLAAILSGLSWRLLDGMGSNSGYAMLVFGNDVLPMYFWFYAHYYVASSLALGLTVLACFAIWGLQRTWSAELTSFRAYPLARKLGLLAVSAIAGGALLGDFLLQPFMPSTLPWFELWGMVIVGALLLVGLIIRQRQLKGEQRHA